MWNEVIIGCGSVKVCLSLDGWETIERTPKVRIVFTSLIQQDSWANA